MSTVGTSLHRYRRKDTWLQSVDVPTQGCVKYACSEEVPEPVDLQGEGFSVAFDPLDGSSIVDTNFTVGTIFGVWPGDQLKGITGREQARWLSRLCANLWHGAARHRRAAPR